MLGEMTFLWQILSLKASLSEIEGTPFPIPFPCFQLSIANGLD